MSGGLFIDVEVDERAAADPRIAAKLSEVCPVDIFFQAEDGTLRMSGANLDECVLCGLCLAAAPAGAVRVLKLYSGEVLRA